MSNMNRIIDSRSVSPDCQDQAQRAWNEIAKLEEMLKIRYDVDPEGKYFVATRGSENVNASKS